MMKFSNCEMTAGHITLKLESGITEYKIYGYVCRHDTPKGEMICLQPADKRKGVVFMAPPEKIASIICEF